MELSQSAVGAPVHTCPCRQHIPSHMGQLSPPGKLWRPDPRGSDRREQAVDVLRGVTGMSQACSWCLCLALGGCQPVFLGVSAGIKTLG